MKINNVFEIGDTVYLKTDTEQRPRIVFAIQTSGPSFVLYGLIAETETSFHYDFEISRDKDIMMTTTN